MQELEKGFAIVTPEDRGGRVWFRGTQDECSFALRKLNPLSVLPSSSDSTSFQYQGWKILPDTQVDEALLLEYLQHNSSLDSALSAFSRPTEASTTWFPVFLQSYREAALVLFSDKEEEFNKDSKEMGEQVDVDMCQDCLEFVTRHRALLVEACGQVGYSWGMAGTDFWLTRNGHGAGFWDRGLGEIGDALTASAKQFGESDLYRGDDGKLYLYSASRSEADLKAVAPQGY